MICNECGSYNAENLTKCKVCGANLRDDDASPAVPDSQNASEDGKPSREFVKAPSWPTRAYSGAPDKTPVASSEAPASSGAFRPTIPPLVTFSAAASVCPHCGKPVLSDAPFCAYCGQRLAGEAAAPARPAAKAPAPAAQPSRKAPPQDDFDDEDDYDDEDEEDYKPQKPAKQRGGKIARRDQQEDLDEYDDEEYDDEEYDDEMPAKRGKGTTILFWGLIVLLLALIAVFGMYIAKKNFDGDVGKMFASIGSVFNKNANSDVTRPILLRRTTPLPARCILLQSANIKIQQRVRFPSISTSLRLRAARFVSLRMQRSKPIRQRSPLTIALSSALRGTYSCRIRLWKAKR